MAGDISELDGIRYRALAPSYGKARYEVVERPEGMGDAEVARMIDQRAALFGYGWDGDVLSVWTD